MLNRINHQLNNLPKAERLVAKQVLEQPRWAVEAPVAEIARVAQVSQPTVIRFCRSMGCDGLSDFKRRLANSLASGVPFVHSSVTLEDSVSDLSAKVFDNTISALLKCRNDLSALSLQQGILLLSEAKRIEFYGQGNSGIIAEDAQHKFFRYGVPTAAYSDPHVHRMAAAVLNAGDVVVAVSASGRSTDIIHSVQMALSVGAKVIAITPSGTPLARIATVALGADVQEDVEVYAPMLSRLVQLVIIDVLAVGVALKRGPEAISQLEKAKRSLREKRVRNGEDV
ncbi:SIS domain-containing protein [Leeia sp. TBRC 13508]|uniref:SIS domain-containing protein n=1 Tax=Leeia speluncae TaxID=2884804 RepID=A0ABS8DAP5_9NEIS|nr:SIS domain-containing protein [Leeia speluncae]MCB6185294.1 SIS domain-containing protein [Leeia speluncae]